MTKDDLWIGTRGSSLALYQAEWVRSRLAELFPSSRFFLKKIRTQGDKISDVPLAQVGGKGLFLKEIEEELIRGGIDLAVHSMKDVPTLLPGPLHLKAITVREDPRDVLISRDHKRFLELPPGARVGTSSLRRQSQLLASRPDLVIVPLRGNLDTRIRKLEDPQLDAIVVAAAGVKRMGLEDRITEYLPPEISLPAIGQGALGIECRVEDQVINEMVAFLDDPPSRQCVMAERAFLARLEGGCQVPIAAHASLEDNILTLSGFIGRVNGTGVIRASSKGDPGGPSQIGVELAEKMLAMGGAQILREIYTQ